MFALSRSLAKSKANPSSFVFAAPIAGMTLSAGRWDNARQEGGFVRWDIVLEATVSLRSDPGIQPWIWDGLKQSGLRGVTDTMAQSGHPLLPIWTVIISALCRRLGRYVAVLT
jgi:hypothetical protein